VGDELLHSLWKFREQAKYLSWFAAPRPLMAHFLDPAANELLPAVDTHLRCVNAVPPSTWRSTESGSQQCWASRDVTLQVTVAE